MWFSIFFVVVVSDSVDALLIDCFFFFFGCMHLNVCCLGIDRGGARVLDPFCFFF